MFSPFPDRLLLSGARRPKPSSSELFECRVYIRHSSAQSAISVISTSYQEKGDEESHFLRLQSQKMRLSSAHRRPGASEKEIFAGRRASTPRTNLFFPSTGFGALVSPPTSQE